MNKNPIKHQPPEAEGFTHPHNLIPSIRPPVKERLLQEKQTLEERLAKVNKALKALENPEMTELLESVLNTIT